MIVTRRALLASGLAAGAIAAAPAFAQASAPALRRLSPKLDRIVAPDAPIEVIATGIRWAEGPVWVPKGGYLLFSDPPANIMRRWSRKDGVSVFLEPSGTPGLDPKLVREAGSNGLALDHQGRLLIANSGGGSIDRLDLGTKARTVLAHAYQGLRFNSCNDMAVARDGAIFFTDPPYGFTAGDASPLKQAKQNGVYRLTPDGAVTLVEGALTRPNGIALSPDERTLFVSNSDEKDRRIVAIPLDGRGTRSGPTRLFLDANAMPGPGNPDGMKIAADGTMICALPGGMWILGADGEKLGVVEDGTPIANCCFGEDGRTLFMTGATRVLRMPLRIDGRRA